jgi:hypothetical protein
MLTIQLAYSTYSKLSASKISKSIRYSCPYCRYLIASCRSRDWYNTKWKNHWSSTRCSQMDYQIISATSSSIRSWNCIHKSTRNWWWGRDGETDVNIHVCQFITCSIRVCPLSLPLSMSMSELTIRSCLELITYTPHSPTQTLFHQKATIVSGFPTAFVARKVEQASIDRFKSNAGVGKKGFEWVLAGGQVTGRGCKSLHSLQSQNQVQIADVQTGQLVRVLVWSQIRLNSIYTHRTFIVIALNSHQHVFLCCHPFPCSIV